VPIRVMQHRLPLTPRLISGLLNNGCARSHRSHGQRIDIVDAKADRDSRVARRRWTLVKLQLDAVARHEHGHAGHLVLERDAESALIKATSSVKTLDRDSNPRQDWHATKVLNSGATAVGNRPSCRYSVDVKWLRDLAVAVAAILIAAVIVSLWDGANYDTKRVTIEITSGAVMVAIIFVVYRRALLPWVRGQWGLVIGTALVATSLAILGVFWAATFVPKWFGYS
jgi:hypothetical protein